MNDKPKIRWHADGEGKCHVGCEARRETEPGVSTGCSIADLVPWMRILQVEHFGPCPFTVLSDVLCAVKPHEEPEAKPSPQDVAGLVELAWNCGCRFGRDAGGGTTVRENKQKDADIKRLRTMEECHGGSALKPDDDRQCGTCTEGFPYGSKVAARVPCNHYTDSVNRPDGPPWPNCRFWKERS